MLYFLILIFLTSCTPKANDYIANVNIVIGKEIKKIREEDDLQVFGYGGAMMEGIEDISVIFDSYKKVDVAEARRMIVKCTESLKNAVNAKGELRPYLIPYPYPIEGFSTGIMFIQKNGKFIEYGCVLSGTGGVSCVSLQKGKLFYSSYNPQTTLLEPYYKETYEDALAIINSEENLDNEECPSDYEAMDLHES